MASPSLVTLDQSKITFWQSLQVGAVALVDNNQATADVVRIIDLWEARNLARWRSVEFKYHASQKPNQWLMVKMVDGVCDFFVYDQEVVGSRKELLQDCPVIFDEEGITRNLPPNDVLFATAIHHDETNVDYVMKQDTLLCNAQLLPALEGVGVLKALVTEYGAVRIEPTNPYCALCVIEIFDPTNDDGGEVRLLRGRLATGPDEFSIVPVVS